MNRWISPHTKGRSAFVLFGTVVMLVGGVLLICWQTWDSRASASPVGSSPSFANEISRQMKEEDRLIEQLVNGEPAEKMVAARELQQRGTKRAVPYLLAEARDNYPRPFFKPGTPADLWEGGTVYARNREGEIVPYIDYHAPLFEALSSLSVPYFGNDQEWFAAIDRWIEQNLPEARR